MKITILAYGSRGDVQPYLALGLGLKRAGYQVRLAAPAQFEPFITAHGLCFSPLPGDTTRLMADAVQKVGSASNPVLMAQAVLRHIEPIGGQVASAVQSACLEADAVIHSLLLTPLGHAIARRQGIPDISALVFPVFSPTAQFPNPLFPPWNLGRRYNVETHEQFGGVFWHAARLGMARLRRANTTLPHLPRWPFAPFNPNPTPLLYGFSPRVIPCPPEWSFRVHETGYWVLEEEAGWHPPVELERFLAGGPPPVFIGFGSVVNSEAHSLAYIALEALRLTGQRGVLLSGWGGLAASDLPSGDLPGTVCLVESAPLEWLFPRVAAAVHHGGMGTTASALRAGIPSFVIPFTFDQPFWGRRVRQLGVGPAPVPFRRLTAEALAQGIQQMLSDAAMRERAAALGCMLRAEDGVANAVALIRDYLGPPA